MEIIKPQTNSFWFEMQQLGFCNKLISLLCVFFVKGISLESLDSEGCRIDPFKNSHVTPGNWTCVQILYYKGKNDTFSSRSKDHEIISGCKNGGEFHHRVEQSSQKASIKGIRVCMDSLTGNPLLQELLLI